MLRYKLGGFSPFCRKCVEKMMKIRQKIVKDLNLTKKKMLRNWQKAWSFNAFAAYVNGWHATCYI